MGQLDDVPMSANPSLHCILAVSDPERLSQLQVREQPRSGHRRGVRAERAHHVDGDADRLPRLQRRRIQYVGQMEGERAKIAAAEIEAGGWAERAAFHLHRHRVASDVGELRIAIQFDMQGGILEESAWTVYSNDSGSLSRAG